MSLETTIGFKNKDYLRLVEKTKAIYNIVGFEILELPDLPQKFAILRHDIDMSPSSALRLAQLEAKCGIRSSYTVLLSGQFYNPFERKIRDMLKGIAACGHAIGLHFDASWHEIESEDQLEEAIKWEASILNQLLNLNINEQVKFFSFHNTTPFTMACKKKTYGNLRNAYAGVLQKHVQYTSDSNGFWRYRSWDQLLEEQHDCIQVLTHPEWWQQVDMEPAEKVCREISSREKSVWIGYCRLLDDCRRDNKTGLKQADHILPALFGEQGLRLIQLWLAGDRVQAYIELYAHFERKARQLLHKILRAKLNASVPETNALLSDFILRIDSVKGLATIANISLTKLLSCSSRKYRALKNTRHALVYGCGSISPDRLSKSFNQLSVLVKSLVDWGKLYTLISEGSSRMATENERKTTSTQVSALGKWLIANQERLQLSRMSTKEFLSKNSHHLLGSESRHNN